MRPLERVDTGMELQGWSGDAGHCWGQGMVHAYAGAPCAMRQHAMRARRALPVQANAAHPSRSQSSGGPGHAAPQLWATAPHCRARTPHPKWPWTGRLCEQPRTPTGVQSRRGCAAAPAHTQDGPPWLPCSRAAYGVSSVAARGWVSWCSTRRRTLELGRLRGHDPPDGPLDI